MDLKLDQPLRRLAILCLGFIASPSLTDAAPAAQHPKHAAASTQLVLEFSGSPEAFDVALKRNLEIRAKQFGLDPALYDDELKQIHDMVETCMGVTATDFAAAESAERSEMQYAARHGGINPIRREMERLKFCDGGIGEVPYFGAKISDPSKPRALGVSRSMSIFQNGQKVATPYTTFTVAFYGAAEDKEKFTLSSTSEIPSHYQIIQAQIMRPAAQELAAKANAPVSPTDCVKLVNHVRDFGLDYLFFQNACDQPYRVNANTRSGKIISTVVGKGAPIRFPAIVSSTGGFTGNYSVVEP